MVLIIFIGPLTLSLCNVLLGNRLVGWPYKLNGQDFPLMSLMYLSKNYSGEAYRFNLYNGFSKIKYSTNDLGLRSPQISYSKDIILVSGDSTIFGYDLNDDETVPYLLGEKFERKYDVVNAGIPGKAMPHNLLTLQNFLKLSKEKNIKIKCFVNWMFDDDFSYGRTIEEVRRKATKEDLSTISKMRLKFPILSTVYAQVRNPKNLLLMNMAVKQFSMGKLSYRIDDGVHLEPYAPNEEDGIRKRNFGYFHEIQKLSEENGIILLNVIASSEYKDIVYENTRSDYMEAFLKKIGGRNIIKMKAVYRSQNDLPIPQIAGINNNFGHYSKEGADIIAQYLHDYIDSLERDS